MVRVARVVFAVMALLFVYAAVVQWNDPDPLIWITMYAIAAVVCGMFAVNRPAPWKVVAALAVISTSWTIWLATIVFGGGELRQMFPEEDKTGSVLVDAEEGREMGGLAIVSATLIPLAFVQRRRE